jgi:hypothetical protein
MNIEEMIAKYYTIYKICGVLKVGNPKAKSLLLDHFGNDKELNEYIEKSQKTSTNNRTYKIKAPRKKSTVQKMRSRKILRDLYFTETSEYFMYAAELYDSGVDFSFDALVQIMIKQLQHSNDVPQIKHRLKLFIEEGLYKAGSSMKSSWWCLLYGEELGEILHRERLSKCNSLLGKEEEEIAQIKKRVSDGVRLFYLDLTKYEKQCRSYRCVEFWMKRGYSEKEATEKVESITDELRENTHWGDIKYVNSIRSEENTNTNLKYWVKRFGEKDGPKLYKNRQHTFSLESCILKYGELEGNKIWTTRQDKWQQTLNNKTDIEKHEILLKKCVPLGKSSKESIKFFDMLMNDLNMEFGLTIDDFCIGAYDKKELFIWDSEEKRISFYDFCIPSLKIIIEFHGEGFHFDEISSKIPKNFFSLDEGMVRKKDEYKKLLAETNGYIYEVVWEKQRSEYEDDRIRILDRIRSSYISNKGAAKNS